MEYHPIGHLAGPFGPLGGSQQAQYLDTWRGMTPVQQAWVEVEAAGHDHRASMIALRMAELNLWIVGALIVAVFLAFMGGYGLCQDRAKRKAKATPTA